MEEVKTATLPALASAISGWFPELQGRSVAVTDATVTRENVPSLPVCLVSLTREVGNHAVKSKHIQPTQDIFVEFWFTPERYKAHDGAETPFWAYYDFESIRDILVSRILNWKTPRGFMLSYVSMEIEATSFAVMIVFKFTHQFDFCILEFEDEKPDGLPPRIAFTISPAPSVSCPEDVTQDNKVEDPCP